MKNIVILSLFGLTALVLSCGSEGGETDDSDNFNRTAMLENWSDNLIIPGYQNLSTKLGELKTATSTFTSSPSELNLTATREAWFSAYLAWQKVDMYEIGKAEEMTLRNYMNVYPLNESETEATLLSGSYDLSSVNRQDEQGFSAVDYLLHGLADTDAEIVAAYTDEANGSKYKTYLTDVVTRMETLVNTVLSDWTDNYRDIFVSRDGSSATESVNKLVNDYIFYFEKYLRAGKIGIPAGVFSSTTLPDRVEARFRADVSKQLFVTALDASEDFFNGIHFDGSADGISLDDYLNELNKVKQGEDLTGLINDQFASIQTTASDLDDDFSAQVENNNTLMTLTYDELQKNVVFLKVDMLQALNIKVDYVDADGD